MESNTGQLPTFIRSHVPRPWFKRPSPPSLPTVLIVDDEAPVRKFVDRVLRNEGYTTVLASDGVEALQAAAQLKTGDILVTDLMMPQMRGDQLAGRLRQDEPGLKVLYLTGFSDRLFQEKVTLWDDEAFLDKPCSVDALREAVSLLLCGSTRGPQGQLRPRS